MSIFRRDRAVEIVAASGMLRVAVTPKPAWFALAVEGVLVIVLAAISFRDWHSMEMWVRVLVAWATVSAIAAWLYQLTGSEFIEIDAQKLVISKHILGWDRTREYAIADCHDLEYRESKGEGANTALQCKVGWRRITFAEYISEDEAIEVLTALQTNLPEVAHRVLANSSPTKKHFTTLDLN